MEDIIPADLFAPAADEVSGPAGELLPVRMLNEFAYCPRLFHFMHVEGRWEDNHYTVEGRTVHRRVDKVEHLLPDAAGSAPSTQNSAPSTLIEPEPQSRRQSSALPRDKGTFDEPPAIARSVPLSSEKLGISAKLDLVGTEGDLAVPVETKRGRVPANPERSWEPERVQLMAQGLLLRENGYRCDHGMLFFAGSRTRVKVPFTAELEARTLELLALAKVAAKAVTLPPPLEDSPKCNGCSLAGICLPDETLALQHGGGTDGSPVVRQAGSHVSLRILEGGETDGPPVLQEGKDAGKLPLIRGETTAAATALGEKDMGRLPMPLEGKDMGKMPMIHEEKDAGRMAPPLKPRAGTEDEDGPAIRRMYPAREDALPLYVQEQGAYVGKSGKSLLVKIEGKEVSRVGIKDVSQLVLCGNIQVTTQTLHMLCEAGIPVVYLSSGMWFYGVTQGISLRNAYDRAAQFATAADAARSLEFARSLIADKAENQRTLIRRNVPPSVGLDHTLEEIDDLIVSIKKATGVEQLLGLEGNVAARYFSRFSGMLKPKDFDAEWDFTSRNRRPPKDPVNAMLSFAYAMLAKECTVALLGEGLDPWWGLYHKPRHGRPSMALDLMEPFRPIVADSAVITAINTGMVRSADFQRAASGCAMADTARKALLRAYEARLDQLITHPQFDYRCSWRSVIKLQARLLSRWLRGDIPAFTSVVTR